MIVPPPVTFSTMKFCFSFVDSAVATWRASWSTGPPRWVRHDDGNGAVWIWLRRYGRNGNDKAKQGQCGNHETLHWGSSLCVVLFFASLYLMKDG
jgi:hypothetical protein